MFNEFEDKGKIFTQKITKEQREVIIQTIHQKISGTVYIQMDLRLIDELNNQSGFIALTNVKIFDEHDQVKTKSKFLALNTNQIIWILPINEINDD